MFFLTKEEAEFESKKRAVYTKVKKYAYDFSREEWEDDSILKWFAYYNIRDDVLEIDWTTMSRRNILYFKSNEDIAKAIDEVGEEDFIRYYLGVRDYE